MSATIKTTHADTRCSGCEWQLCAGLYCPACGKFNHVWSDLLTDDYYVGRTLVCLMCESSFTLQPGANWAAVAGAPYPGPWTPEKVVKEAVEQIRAALAADPSLGGDPVPGAEVK